MHDLLIEIQIPELVYMIIIMPSTTQVLAFACRDSDIETKINRKHSGG